MEAASQILHLVTSHAVSSTNIEKELISQFLLKNVRPGINEQRQSVADLGFHEGGFVRLGTLCGRKIFSLQTTPTSGQKPRPST